MADKGNQATVRAKHTKTRGHHFTNHLVRSRECNRCELSRVQSTQLHIRPEGRVTSWQETCSSSKEGEDT